MQDGHETPAANAEASGGFNVDEAVALLESENALPNPDAELAEIDDPREGEFEDEDSSESDEAADLGDEDGEESAEESEEDDQADEEADDGSDEEKADNKSDDKGKPKRQTGYQRLKAKFEKSTEKLYETQAQLEEYAGRDKAWQEAYQALEAEYKELRKTAVEESYLDPNEIKIQDLEREIANIKGAPERDKAQAKKAEQLRQQARDRAAAEAYFAEAEELCEEFGLKSPRSLLLRMQAEVDELDEGQNWPELRDVAARQARLKENRSRRTAAEKTKKQAAVNAQAPKPSKTGRSPRRDYSKPTVENMEAYLMDELGGGS